MYADDIVILAESEDDLQQLLDTVNRWCREWRMQINSSKTNIIHFRKMSSNKTNVTFHIGGYAIEVVSQYKYLGCVLTEHIDFSETAKVLAESAERALGALINKARNINGLTFNVYSKLYETSVMPIANYSAGIWGYKCYPKSETMQIRALRTFLGVNKFAPTLVVNGDTGWPSMRIRRHLEMVRLWNRLVSMSEDRLTKKGI